MRLLQVSLAGFVLVSKAIWTAGYTGDALRAWKQTASGRRYYLYDGEELVCELDAACNPVAGVVFGANGLLVYGATGYQFDPQGNAVHLMDDDGLVLAHLAYDAWGQRMSGNNPTPYGYKGQWGYYTDAETGLLLLTHRYFDPAMGRFLTRDPIGFEGGINLYAYVGNGVVMRRDPSGRLAIGAIIGGACGFACAWVAACFLSNWNSCWNRPDIKWEQEPCIGFRPKPGIEREFWDRLRRTLDCLMDECCRGGFSQWMCRGCTYCIWAALAYAGISRLPLPALGTGLQPVLVRY
jgi:RHS repeat-associated protein